MESRESPPSATGLWHRRYAHSNVRFAGSGRGNMSAGGVQRNQRTATSRAVLRPDGNKQLGRQTLQQVERWRHPSSAAETRALNWNANLHGSPSRPPNNATENSLGMVQLASQWREHRKTLLAGRVDKGFDQNRSVVGHHTNQSAPKPAIYSRSARAALSVSRHSSRDSRSVQIVESTLTPHETARRLLRRAPAR